MPRVALYARVSTADQTVEPQIHALRQYAAARGLEQVVEYIDHGISGARDRRPALDRLVADARRRRLDMVAVVKLDRLARSVRHLTQLAGDFEALGVGLVVLDQGIDTTTPSGRLLVHLLAAVAEPSIYPFFDELVAAQVPGLGVVKWTLGYYARYAEALRHRARTLGGEWTPLLVERAVWASLGGKAGKAALGDAR